MWKHIGYSATLLKRRKWENGKKETAWWSNEIKRDVEKKKK